MTVIPRCGKVIYVTATQAHGAMMAKRSPCSDCGREGIKLHYYYCEPCDGYHLTRLNTRQQREFKKKQIRAIELRNEFPLMGYQNYKKESKKLQLDKEDKI